MEIDLRTSAVINQIGSEVILENQRQTDPTEENYLQQARFDVSDLQHGPYDQTKRQCKDIFWFFFYWLNTLAMIVLSAWAYFTGNPGNIYRATDSYNNVCGKRDTPVQNFKYSYFFNPTTNDLSKRVCVEKCPRLENGNTFNFSCYSDGPSCNVNITVGEDGNPSQTLTPNGNYFIGYQSEQKIDRICLPSQESFRNVFYPYNQAMADGLIQSKLLDLVCDVQNNYGWLFVMGGVAIIFSILYWLGLKFFPVFSVWASLLMTISLFCIIAFVFLYNGGALTLTDEQGRLGIRTPKNRNFYNIYGAFCMAFTIITIIVFVCCYHQTGPTIQMIKIASKFFRQLPTALLVVLMMTVMMYLFWMTAISSAIYALSASDYSPIGKVFTEVSGNADRGIIMLYYFLFNAFWTHEIFIATMVFGVSSVTAKWYFHTGPVQEMDKPMWKTLMMIMPRLFGSVAFGSLILLLVQFLQFFLEIFIFLHSWKYHNSNKCFKCVDNCLQFVSRAMKLVTLRLNRFAYVQIALRGKNFVQSSKDGFRLVNLNSQRYGFLFNVDSILFFMIKLGIALIPTTLFYLLASFWQYAQTSILEPIYFVLIIFYFSLGMSSVIIGSYSACIDALMTCYVIDQINQKQKNEGKPLYACEQMAELFKFNR